MGILVSPFLFTETVKDMATYARKLKDASGNFVAPATRSSCVYMGDNTNLEDYLSSLKSDLLKEIEDSVLTSYPVGSVYQSSNSTSPASLFGGTWEKIQGRFLLGSSSSHAVTSTGGEEKHTLTSSEMPNHNHLFSNFYGVNWGSSSLDTSLITNVNSTEYGVSAKAGKYGSNPFGVDRDGYNKTAYSGSGQSHNNMPPFYTVNIWRRTA